MADDAPFRAIVKGAFELAGRGTVISVEIVDGKIAAGDTILVPTATGDAHVVIVRDIGFFDHAIGRADAHAYALRIDTLRAADVAVGAEIRSAWTVAP